MATYLALTSKSSRTAAGIARDLSLPEEEVAATLSGFAGIFRRSRNTSSAGEPYYTLHARYAMRAVDSDSETPELRADLLAVVLQFVARRAEHEVAATQFQQQARISQLGIWVAACAAVIAAGASIAGAFIGG